MSDKILSENLGEMPDQADEVLQFWLIDTPRESYFIRDAAFDQQITEKFAARW